MIDLFSKLPNYYEGRNIKNIVGSLETQVTKSHQGQQNVKNNLAISTAEKDGVTLYEREYGITKNSDDIETRRAVVLAKIRGRGVTTRQMVEDIAESFVSGNVEVREDGNEFLIIIKFVHDTGTPKGLESLTESLYEIIPAHADIKYEFTYIKWNEVHGTWDEASAKTWNQLRGEKNG